MRTCGIIGEGGFALRCAHTVIDRWGAEALRFLASPDGSLAALAAAHGLPHHAQRSAMVDSLATEPVDLLFSANNPWVVPAAALGAVRELAVNYHDSLLPAYAGLHATSWALLDGATTHGVTFHEMATELDAGAILVQREVAVDPDERAFTLNAKCFEAALDGFHELLERIDAGTLERRPAEPPTSYFGRDHRPPGGAFLDPRLPAPLLERMVRALDFGPVPNPIAAPRVWIDGAVVAVRRASLGSGAGPVLRCADGDVCLESLEHLDGRPLSPAEVGTPAAPPDLDRWIERDARWAPHEGFWLRRWAEPTFEHPFATAPAGPPARHADPSLTEALDALAAAVACDRQHAGILAMTVYGAKVGAAGNGGRAIGFRGHAQAEARGLLYAPVVPLRSPPTERSGNELARWLERELERVAARGTIALDAMRRRSGQPSEVSLATVDVRVIADLPAAELTLDLTDEPALLSNGALDPDRLEQIAAHLTALARALAAEPEAPADAATLVPDDERAVVEGCHGPRLELDPTPVPLRLTRALHGAGERPVLTGEHESLDGTTAAERIDAVARALVDRGARDVVAVRAETPVQQAIALLGVMRAGAAYVPIDPELPPARAETILEDVAPTVVIGPEDTPLTELLAEGAESDARLPTPALSDPAYVIFTSGSTGRPKGVVVTHGNLASQLDARMAGYGDPPAVLSTLHSLAFDSALAGLYWALCCGAELLLSSARTRRDPDAIRALLASRRPTHLDVPPSTWQEVLAAATPAELSSLRVVIVGGEACPPELVREHRRQLPGVALHNEYGPTEATIYSTVHRADDTEGPVPIGRPIANAHCVVADPRGAPLPIDVPGELWIAGPGVARGYLGRPALTAERFVERAGERFYRTGDRVRLDRDGLLWISGRLDQQVQIRGHRVELGEVERALVALPEVARAVVSPRERRGSTELVAHLVPAAGSDVDPPTLRDALSERLPEPMIPAAFGTIDVIPLTPAGKVDRSALPAVVVAPPIGAPPRTALERQVAEVVADEIGVDRIGVEDDFFDSGGSSLVAMRVVRRIGELIDGGEDLGVADVYRERTVARLARRIEGLAPRASAVPHSPYLIPIQHGDERRTPVFGVHVLGEEACFYRPLAERLGPERPVFGLASPFTGEGGDHPTQVEELATLYLGALRERWPEGPYCLAAVSLAGVVAWEMAVQLRRDGQEVELLTLFDCLGPHPPPSPLSSRLKKHLGFLRDGGLGYLRSRMRRREKLMREWARDLRLAALERLGRELPDEMKLQLVMRENLEAAVGYEIPRLDGPVLVYRATEEAFYDPAYVASGLGWGDHARRVEVVDVPGTHTGILEEPGVRVLAEDLGRRLEALDRDLATEPFGPGAPALASRR